MPTLTLRLWGKFLNWSVRVTLWFLWMYIYKLRFSDYGPNNTAGCTLRHNHTERQATRQAARSHWNTLWCSKMGPRSIPKCHGNCQNFKAATWRLTLDARCVYTLKVSCARIKDYSKFQFQFSFLIHYSVKRVLRRLSVTSLIMVSHWSLCKRIPKYPNNLNQNK